MSPQLCQWQAKVKNRAVAQLACDSELAAVGFYNGFADGQSHAGSVDLHALIPAAVEFFEDERLFEIVNARTAIGNADGQHLLVVRGFGGTPDGSARGRTLGGVLCQLTQHSC